LPSKTHHERQKGHACFFLTNQDPAIQIAEPKGKSVNAKFYKGIVLHKVKKYLKNRRPATGLLHDNTSSQIAAIIREYLKQEKVVELPHPPNSPDLDPCDFSYFRGSKKHLNGTKNLTQKYLGSAVFQCLISIPRKDYENAFKIGFKDNNCVYHMVVSILKN
jgi:hypothetical protein